MTQRDLAAELGISVSGAKFSGAKSRVQRARARLKPPLLDCCHFELDRRRGEVINYYGREHPPDPTHSRDPIRGRPLQNPLQKHSPRNDITLYDKVRLNPGMMYRLLRRSMPLQLATKTPANSPGYPRLSLPLLQCSAETEPCSAPPLTPAHWRAGRPQRAIKPAAAASSKVLLGS